MLVSWCKHYVRQHGTESALFQTCLLRSLEMDHELATVQAQRAHPKYPLPSGTQRPPGPPRS